MAEWSVTDAPSEDIVVFALAGDRAGIAVGDVEGINPPVPLRKIPHAGPALLGAANLGGQIMPILDLTLLVGGAAAVQRPYDGKGEIIRVRSAQGSVGFWVDRVERLAKSSIAESGELTLLDPTALLSDCLRPPSLGAANASSLEAAEADRIEDAEANPGLSAFSAADREMAWVLVDIAGQKLALPREDVAELLDNVRWTRIPRSPRGLLGVAVLRGNALPVLSISQAATTPASFARVHLANAQALLAVDRIIGLHHGDPGNAHVIQLDSAVGDELHALARAFVPFEEAGEESQSAGPDGARQYLSFSVGEQQFALPAACVERVVDAPQLISLPGLPGPDTAASMTAGAIEIRGQIIPVAAIRRRLGLGSESPLAYAVLRTVDGIGAIEIDQLGALVTLSPDQILPPPPDADLLCGVAHLSGGQPLRIIEPELLWRNS